MAKNDITFKVQNFEIKLGESYEITGKLDLDAPEGFRAHNTTKYLIGGIGDVRSVPFDDIRNLWDTGFDEDDESNQSVHPDERAARVKAFVDHIKKTYEKKYNVKLDNIDRPDSPWLNFKIDLYKGRTFDTSNEKDRLELFLALQHYYLHDKDDKSYKKSNASFNLINKIKVTDIKKDRYNNKLKALKVFNTLLDSGLEDLYIILEWLGYSSVRNTPKENLLFSVMESFEAEEGHIAISNFLDTYKMTQDNTKKEELEIFSLLNELRYKGKVKYERREFLLDGEVIGNSLKDASKRALANPDLIDKIKNIAATELSK